MAFRRTNRRRSQRWHLHKSLTCEMLEDRRLLAVGLSGVESEWQVLEQLDHHDAAIATQPPLNFTVVEYGPQPAPGWSYLESGSGTGENAQISAQMISGVDYGAGEADAHHGVEDHADEIPEAFEFQEWGYGRYERPEGLAAGGTGEGERSKSGGSGVVGGGGSGAAPNYHVEYVSVRDADGALVDSIPVGQMIAIQIVFTTEGIPAGTPLGMRFTVDDMDRYATVDWAVGTGTWYAWWSGWYAGPGERTYSIELDYANEVVETDETDNVGEDTFTPYIPTDLPQQLLFPTEGVRNVDFAINNYADVDPRDNYQSDFAGGIFQYNGHSAWDLGPANFLDQDQGFAILAAADGVVVDLDEGNFDRKSSWENTPANFVIIDHGNNWNTIYWHLARDSVNVEIGQQVKAGDIIGNMGSSGISTGTHVHYTLRRFNFPVETMFDTDTYYHPDADVDYQPDTITGPIDGNISNIDSPVNSDWRESFPTRRTFGGDTSERVVFNFRLSHLNNGDQYLVRFVAPDGNFWQGSYNATQQLRFPGWYWWIGSGIWNTQVGTWEAQVLMDGSPILIEPFEVSSSTADSQIRVYDVDDLNVNPGRTTPYDFSTRVGLQREFSITNHGDSNLLLGPPEMPLGFSLATAFPTTVVPGADVPFTVQYDGGLNSKAFGAMRFTTSDPDLPEFWFNLEGEFSGSVPDEVSELSLEEAALAHILGTPPSPFEDEAQFLRGTAEAATAMLSFIWEGGRQTGDELILQDRDGVTTDDDGIYLDGTLIGTIVSDGQAPAPLVIELVASEIAEATVVESLIAAVDFDTSSSVAGPRFLRLFTTDAENVMSTHAYKAVRVHDPIYPLATMDEIRYNDEVQQRSRVQTIDVEFDQIVEIDPSAFAVNKVDGQGGSVDVSVSTQDIDGRTIATLSLSGSFVTNASLVDGRYELLVDGDKIIGSYGQAADVDGDGVRGGTAEIAFHRFFGDYDGNEVVDVADFLEFRTAFGTAVGDADYFDPFDEDDDEAINVSDFLVFRSQFGNSLP